MDKKIVQPVENDRGLIINRSFYAGGQSVSRIHDQPRMSPPGPVKSSAMRTGTHAQLGSALLSRSERRHLVLGEARRTGRILRGAKGDNGASKHAHGVWGSCRTCGGHGPFVASTAGAGVIVNEPRISIGLEPVPTVNWNETVLAPAAAPASGFLASWGVAPVRAPRGKGGGATAGP